MLKQYGWEIKDYRRVNFTLMLSTYYRPDTQQEDSVEFVFKGKNCFLRSQEYEAIAAILPRVEQMTISWCPALGIGATQAVWQPGDKVATLEHDLLGGLFQVKAVLTSL